MMRDNMKKLILILFSLTLWVNQIFAGSSRDFEAGHTEGFYSTTIWVTGTTTISYFAWFCSESSGATNIIGGSNASTTSDYELLFTDATTNYVRINTRNATTPNPSAISTNTLSLGAWSRACGVRSALNARTINLDGTVTTDTTAQTAAATLDRSNIGIMIRPSVPSSYYDGLIAFAACWNTNLSLAQQNELMWGIPPIYMATANCKGYYPLQEASGNAIDKSGNANTLIEYSGTIDVSTSSPPYVFIPQGGQ